MILKDQIQHNLIPTEARYSYDVQHSIQSFFNYWNSYRMYEIPNFPVIAYGFVTDKQPLYIQYIQALINKWYPISDDVEYLILEYVPNSLAKIVVSYCPLKLELVRCQNTWIFSLYELMIPAIRYQFASNPYYTTLQDDTEYLLDLARRCLNESQFNHYVHCKKWLIYFEFLAYFMISHFNIESILDLQDGTRARTNIQLNLCWITRTDFKSLFIQWYQLKHPGTHRVRIWEGENIFIQAMDQITMTWHEVSCGFFVRVRDRRIRSYWFNFNVLIAYLPGEFWKLCLMYRNRYKIRNVQLHTFSCRIKHVKVIHPWITNSLGLLTRK